MENATYDAQTVDIKANNYIFKANGSKIKFAGFTKIYVEATDNDAETGKLPELENGEMLELSKLNESQKFTEPPARFTEASLIKTMEEDGIGRPSTYAPTISTILARGYIAKEKKSLYPTELGTIVTDLMTEHFNDIVDVDFTAKMEKQLDDVEAGSVDWVKIIGDFYEPFIKTLTEAEKNIGNIEVKDEVSDVPCDKCGRMMVYKMGRFGKFLACPGFPECRNAKPIVKETGVNCPKCGGKILVKKSKRGKEYFGCENNPKCDFMTWYKPIDKKCPKCGWVMVEKRIRGKVTEQCSNEECGK